MSIVSKIGDRFALYNGDCVEVMKSLPDEAVHLSIYSPPFGGLYHYSSDPRDLSNCDDYAQFFEHYTYVVRELARITMPGRITAVHCMVRAAGRTAGPIATSTLAANIIRLHEREGWLFTGRRVIWKEAVGGSFAHDAERTWLTLRWSMTASTVA